MAWISSDSILLTTDWQYTDPIPSGLFFRLVHTEAPSGALFIIAQAEVTAEGAVSLIDSQVMAVDKKISDAIKLFNPGCFSDRRIAIKKLPKQPTLEQEVKRLFLPGYLQPSNDDIRIVSRSNWSVDIEICDFVEPALIVDLAPIHTKLDALSASLEALRNLSGGATSPTTTLTYVSNGDTNGVFYYLGTDKNTVAFTNPAASGKVIITGSNPFPGRNANDLVGRNNTSYSSGGESGIGQTITIDLGINRKLALKTYTFSGRADENGYHLRSWNFRGSNDSSAWTILDTQVNNSTIGLNTYYNKTLASESIGFRYFQIITTGNDSSGFTALSGNEIELYGTLTETN